MCTTSACSRTATGRTRIRTSAAAGADHCPIAQVRWGLGLRCSSACTPASAGPALLSSRPSVPAAPGAVRQVLVRALPQSARLPAQLPVRSRRALAVAPGHVPPSAQEHCPSTLRARVAPHTPASPSWRRMWRRQRSREGVAAWVWSPFYVRTVRILPCSDMILQKWRAARPTPIARSTRLTVLTIRQTSRAPRSPRRRSARLARVSASGWLPRVPSLETMWRDETSLLFHRAIVDFAKQAGPVGHVECEFVFLAANGYSDLVAGRFKSEGRLIRSTDRIDVT